MDEILLTDEEVVDARTNAEVAVWARHGDISEQIQAGTEAVLRAQVLKVVEWMERETAPHDPNHYWMGARRILREETLAALREAAGGEEK